MLGKTMIAKMSVRCTLTICFHFCRLYPKDINVAFATGLPTMFGVPK